MRWGYVNTSVLCKYHCVQLRVICDHEGRISNISIKMMGFPYLGKLKQTIRGEIKIQK